MTPSIELQRSYRYPNDEISWAGACPWTGGVSFGTDNGNLIVPGFLPDKNEARSLLVNRDTVNGLAFGDDFVISSSPTEVTRLTDSGELETIYAGGAHDVVRLNKCVYLAPLGPYGVLSIVARTDSWDVYTERDRNGETYMYRMCILATRDGRSTIACAGRGTGLILYQCDEQGDHPSVYSRAIPEHDLIDICPLPIDGKPFAVAALTHDGSLLLTGNVLNEAPTSAALTGLEGTGYTLKTIRDHLLILTSKALYVLENFSTRFARGDWLNSPRRTIRVEASDVYVVRDEFVLIESEGGIECHSIDEVIKPVADSAPEGGMIVPAVDDYSNSPMRQIDLVPA